MDSQTYNVKFELRNLDRAAAVRVKDALKTMMENGGLASNIVTLEIVKPNG
jgi:hypothetical protein